MIRRPQPGETEEDLLAFQEQFLSSEQDSSAKLLKPNSKRAPFHPTHSKDVVTLEEPVQSMESSRQPPQKRSKFKERRQKSEQDGPLDGETMDEFTARKDTHITKLLWDVQEKDVITPFVSSTSLYARKGFPKVCEIATPEKQTQRQGKEGADKKESLFLQQFGNAPLEVLGMESHESLPETLSKVQNTDCVTMDTGNNESTKPSLLPSAILTGKGLQIGDKSEKQIEKELNDIHKENLEFLSKMTEDDIVKERAKLMESLNPDILAFLSNKKDVQTRRSTSEEKKGGSQVDQERAGIADDLKGRWVNMDVVEGDKMEWMKRLPETDKNIQHSTRYSFDGCVISEKIDLPSHVGLHHHGNEPEMAGYTLHELIHLARSSVLQQRVLSINVLSKIAERSHRKEYIGLVDPPPFEVLMDLGFPLILRYALDESSVAMVTAAIQALNRLLVPSDEEDEYYYSHFCAFGMNQPLLGQSLSKSTATLTEKEDTALLKENLVQGLLKMGLLQRLRYILEVMLPQPPVVGYIFGILIKISRHSVQAANDVIHCPRLLNAIQRCYQSTEEHCLSCLRLYLALCCTSKQCALSLMKTCQLVNTILKHGTILPSSSLSQQLYTCSCHIWKVLLGYNLCSEELRDMYPQLMSHLQQYLSTSPSEWTCDRLQSGSALVSLLSSGIHVAATTPQDLLLPESKDTLPSPAVAWSFAEGLLSPMVSLLTLLLRSCVTMETGSLSHRVTHQVQYMSCVLKYLANYTHHLAAGRAGQKVTMAMEALELWLTPSGVMGELLTGNLMSKIISVLIKQYDTDSNVVVQLALYGNTNMLQSDRLTQNHKTSLVHSFEDLLLNTFDTLNNMVKFHKGVAVKVAKLFSISHVTSYMRQFCNVKHAHVASYKFGRLLIFYYLTQLCTSIVSVSPDLVGDDVLGLCYCVSVKLLSTLPPGCESQVVQLLENTMFQPTFFRSSVGVLDGSIQSLGLSDAPNPVTAITQKTSQEVLVEAVGDLHLAQHMMVSHLKKTCISEKMIANSRKLFCYKVTQVESLSLPRNTGPFLPSDWLMLPIVYHYTDNLNRLTQDQMDSSEEMVEDITRCLHFWVLLEHTAPQALENCSLSLKITRLMCVFLTGNDLFLNSNIHTCLLMLLRLYTSTKHLTEIDFSTTIPGIASFYDIYVSLVEQFGAVSYGDGLFAAYLVLPLQQQCPLSFRQLVWGEHANILRLISLKENQLPVPINNFLYPLETDKTMLQLYRRAIRSGSVRENLCPVMFKIAQHHLTANPA